MSKFIFNVANKQRWVLSQEFRFQMLLICQVALEACSKHTHTHRSHRKFRLSSLNLYHFFILTEKSNFLTE